MGLSYILSCLGMSLQAKTCIQLYPVRLEGDDGIWWWSSALFDGAFGSFYNLDLTWGIVVSYNNKYYYIDNILIYFVMATDLHVQIT